MFTSRFKEKVKPHFEVCLLSETVMADLREAETLLKPSCSEHKAVPLCLSYRLLITLLCMAAMMLCFANQSSMGSTMICMTLDDVINGSDVRNSSMEHRYDWDKQTQGWVHSALFIGYYLTQLPSGFLATRYGGRRVVVTGLMVSALSQLLTPLSASVGFEWLCLVRAVCGLSSGFIYAPIFGVLANWVPAVESSLLFGIAGTGMELGSLLVFSLSALVCDLEVAGGWPVVYYVTGGLGVLVMLGFCCLVSDLPAQNRWISPRERGYIETAVEEAGGLGAKKDEDAPLTPEIPVCSILTSLPVWAVVVAQVGSDWLYYLHITVMPSFMQEVMHMPNTMITLLTGLPFLAVIPVIYVSGTFADYVRRKGILSTTAVRKLGDFLCKIFPGAIIVGLGFLGQQHKVLFVALYVLSALLMSFIYVSWVTNPVDLAPAYTGFIASVCETGAMWITIVVPIFVENVTRHKTAEEWQLVFYITGGLQLVAFLFYFTFGSAVLQPWATPCRNSSPPTHEDETKELSSKDQLKDSIQLTTPRSSRGPSHGWANTTAAMYHYASNSEIGTLRVYRNWVGPSGSREREGSSAVGMQQSRQRLNYFRFPQRHGKHGDVIKHMQYGSTAATCRVLSVTVDVTEAGFVTPVASAALRHGALTSPEAGDLFLSDEAVDWLCQKDQVTVSAAAGLSQCFSQPQILEENACDLIGSDELESHENLLSSAESNEMHAGRVQYENAYLPMGSSSLGTVEAYVTMSSRSDRSAASAGEEGRDEHLYESLDLSQSHATSAARSVPYLQVHVHQHNQELGDRIQNVNEEHIYENLDFSEDKAKNLEL